MQIDAIPSPSARWKILALAALTNTLVVAVQTMCLPVLFDEIALDLNLSLVEVGVIWGIGGLPGIFTALIAGAMGDRFGPKRILTLACLLIGIAGGVRALAQGYAGFLGAVFLVGLLTPLVSMNVFKTIGLWFSSVQLGLANGVLSMGMALGFLLSSMISATVLSPLLGGWRNVLLLYGGVAMLFCIPWLLASAPPKAALLEGTSPPHQSMRQGMLHVAGLRNIWLLGITLFGVSGCIQGALGYLPLYLRNQGWVGAAADGAAASFHLISLLFVIPIALLSDRFRSRKWLLLVAGMCIVLGVGLLSVVRGNGVWLAVLLAGMVRDGFMAIFLTMVIETEGVGRSYAGTATGFVMVWGGLGNLASPPLGNSLAQFAPSLPFLLWGAFSLAGMLALIMVRERTRTPAAATVQG